MVITARAAARHLVAILESAGRNVNKRTRWSNNKRGTKKRIKNKNDDNKQDKARKWLGKKYKKEGWLIQEFVLTSKPWIEIYIDKKAFG